MRNQGGEEESRRPATRFEGPAQNLISNSHTRHAHYQSTAATSTCHGHGELGNPDIKNPLNSHTAASAQRLLISTSVSAETPHASQPEKGSAMYAALAANATKDTAQRQPAPKSIPVALPEKETKTQERVGLAQGQQGLPGMYCLVLLAFFATRGRYRYVLFALHHTALASRQPCIVFFVFEGRTVLISREAAGQPWTTRRANKATSSPKTRSTVCLLAHTTSRGFVCVETSSDEQRRQDSRREREMVSLKHVCLFGTLR